MGRLTLPSQHLVGSGGRISRPAWVSINKTNKKLKKKSKSEFMPSNTADPNTASVRGQWLPPHHHEKDLRPLFIFIRLKYIGNSKEALSLSAMSSIVHLAV